jgi:putative restriction endonuclease
MPTAYPKNVSTYIKAFTRLRRSSTNGGAPHKPILLLAVLQWAAQGGIERGQVFITPELVALFRSNWNHLVSGKFDCLMSLPFFHMRTEGFWKLVPRQGAIDLENMAQFTKSLTRLDAAIAYAQLNDDLFALMLDKEANMLLQQTLLQRYFPDAPKSNSPTPYGQLDIFPDISRQILQEDPATYRAKINLLLHDHNDEDLFVRSSMFKRDIPKVYDMRCAISGMRVSATANISMVDACHIIPFAESHDDTISNGIALCPTLHRAFDRGLISISSDYTVLVSSAFTEQPGEYGLKRFAGRPLQLPTEKKFWPGMENLEWHRREVFGV